MIKIIIILCETNVNINIKKCNADIKKNYGKETCSFKAQISVLNLQRSSVIYMILYGRD